MDPYMIIREAILNKHLIVANYDGYERHMCPHVLGVKNGKFQALFYQFGGGSRSGLGPEGSPENWRCITLSKLTNVSSYEGAWHTAPNHSRPQTCVGRIDVEVTY